MTEKDCCRENFEVPKILLVYARVLRETGHRREAKQLEARADIIQARQATVDFSQDVVAVDGLIAAKKKRK